VSRWCSDRGPGDTRVIDGIGTETLGGIPGPEAWYIPYMARYITNLAPYDEARFGHSLLDGMKSAALAVKMGGILPHKALEEAEKLRAEPGGWHVVRTLMHIYPGVAICGVRAIDRCLLQDAYTQRTDRPGSGGYASSSGRRGLYAASHICPFWSAGRVLGARGAVGKATLRYAPILTFAVIYGLLFAPLTFLTF
jgi:hypothetical protein